MPKKVDQIDPNGSIVPDYDPEHVPFDDLKQIIGDGLNQRDWEVKFSENTKSTHRHRFTMSKGGVQLRVIAYIFNNLPWGHRAAEEKRIQLTRPYDEHAKDFDLAKDGNPRCALLGIYRRREKIVFCGWDPSDYKQHKSPSSCYVRTKAMASAVRSGFGFGIDRKSRIVCCFTPDLLAYYLENMQVLHDEVLVEPSAIPESSLTTEELDLPSDPVSVPPKIPHNQIFYGAPGTGKSHRLDSLLSEYFPNPSQFERTTFYPEYTNGTFLGEYRPFPVYRCGDGVLLGPDQKSKLPDYEPLIDYRYVAGPFLRILVRAQSNPNYSFCLVIEEINRAHASAVFGEVFQMLDREDDGTGKFSVTLTQSAQDFLSSQEIKGPIRIPSNMYIWATMNSADQGVLPLDAAFKRRWTLEYVGLDDGEPIVEDWMIKLAFLTRPIKWNDFRRKVNSHLQKIGVAEDRLLGPFFMTKKDLDDPKAFENKLLQYLRDDVVRSQPRSLFVGDSISYGALISSYRNGNNIFVEDVGLVDVE